MIPISKQIINNKQKRAAQRVARFLRLWGSWFLCLFYALFYLLFATYLRQDKKVDNVELNQYHKRCTHIHCSGFNFLTYWGYTKQ